MINHISEVEPLRRGYRHLDEVRVLEVAAPREVVHHRHLPRRRPLPLRAPRPPPSALHSSSLAELPSVPAVQAPSSKSKGRNF
uniref:Uncharacterized protein n=1 Tax=Arundo donax TaxID=35708 RepID=A0A0A9ERB6_ARUDO